MKSFFQNRFVKWVLAPVAVLWALGWAYFQYEYPTCTFRYKLTAEVMTPEGLKTGSSVIEVSYSSTSPIPNPGRWRKDRLIGEAVYVDLGMGKNLFVLLTANESNRIITDRDEYGGGRDSSYLGALRAITLPLVALKLPSIPGNERMMQQQLVAMSNSGIHEIEAENTPTLITFKDIINKNTVVVIDPTKISEVFGEGYSISKLTVEITDSPITQKLNQILPWLEKEKPLNGAVTWNLGDPLIKKIQYQSFIQPTN
jgi:hypothetical protein